MSYKGITLVAMVIYFPQQQGMWPVMPMVTRILPTKYDLNKTQDNKLLRYYCGSHHPKEG